MESFGSFWRRKRLGKLCRPSAATCIDEIRFGCVLSCFRLSSQHYHARSTTTTASPDTALQKPVEHQYPNPQPTSLISMVSLRR